MFFIYIIIFLNSLNFCFEMKGNLTSQNRGGDCVQILDNTWKR